MTLGPVDTANCLNYLCQKKISFFKKVLIDVFIANEIEVDCVYAYVKGHENTRILITTNAGTNTEK